MLIRQPCVAGRFYPGDQTELLHELDHCMPPSQPIETALGIVAPHAGYMYSGKVAGEVYAQVNIPETVILACPNHTGTPVEFSIWAEGQWETPLGNVPVDSDLASRVLEYFPEAESDEEAHLSEHANEVHLPFLQRLRPGVRIVPIVVRCSELEPLKTFGRSLAKAIQACGKATLIIASSDMTHMETHESAKAKDRLAIEQMLKLDEEGLWNTVRQHRISMCGYGPAIVMLTAAKELGATRSRLVRYATSGEVSGDYDRVVGYAGLIVQA